MRYLSRLLLIAIAALLPAACCCGGGGSSSTGYPKPDGKPHGSVTVEATTTR